MYGQAVGETVMTKLAPWSKRGLRQQADAGRARQQLHDEARRSRTSIQSSWVHWPSRDKPVKLIRIEGANLDHVKRSNVKEKK